MVNEGNKDDTCQFRLGTFEKIEIIINKKFPKCGHTTKHWRTSIRDWNKNTKPQQTCLIIVDLVWMMRNNVWKWITNKS